MPLYEYECPAHGVFDQFMVMSARAQPHPCPHCSRPAPRVIATATAVAAMPAAARAAHRVNENSRNEPKISGKLKHGAGCGCCGNKPTRISRRARASPQRPWMIGH
jgi:putative FmdB family regulatory protein